MVLPQLVDARMNLFIRGKLASLSMLERVHVTAKARSQNLDKRARTIKVLVDKALRKV